MDVYIRSAWKECDNVDAVGGVKETIEAISDEERNPMFEEGHPTEEYGRLLEMIVKEFVKNEQTDIY